MNLKKELKFINLRYEFSDNVTDTDKDFLINSGLVTTTEGAVLLTDAGENTIGITADDNYNKEEDITECFFYKDEGENYEY